MADTTTSSDERAVLALVLRAESIVELAGRTLLEDRVGVRAAVPERIDARETAPAVARPGDARRGDLDRRPPEVDARVEAGEVEARRDRLTVERQRRLDDAEQARARLDVAEVALGRADVERIVARLGRGRRRW